MTVASQAHKISRKRKITWGIAALIFALLVILISFPMRVALSISGASDAGLSARSVSGSIWSARLHDARLGALSLGTLNTSLSPLSLLMGEPALRFDRADTSFGPLTGTLYGGASTGVGQVQGGLDLAARVGVISLGRVQMDGVTLRFDAAGRCTQANGQVQLGLTTPVAGLSLAQGLSGALSCVDGDAVATLSSQSGMEKLRLNFDGKGAWTARFQIEQASDPMMINALSAMGFRAGTGGYMMSVSGTF